jgi:serine/threonine protein kinase
VDESSDRWTEVNHSRYPWEREAQAFVREGLPDSDPYAGWANVEFIGDDGTINEIDLLIVSPFGVFLVEIKSHPGTISGDQQRWNWVPPDSKRKQMENPLLSLKRKRDRLENLLFRQSAFRNRSRPRIEPVVFLSSEQLDCQLNPAGRTNVYGRGLPPRRAGAPVLANILDLFKNNLTAEQRRPGPVNTIDRPMAAAIAESIRQANIRPSTGDRRIDEYDMLERIAEGPGWEDWRAEHRTNKLPRRIRRWLSEDTFTEDKRNQLVRAAKREFDLLTVLRHPNILLPIDLKVHELGPALVFDDDADQPSLDEWLAENGPALTLDDRIKLVRDIAEALEFAHRKQVFHRALSPACIRMGQDHRGYDQLRISDWQSSARQSTTRSVVAGTQHVDDLMVDSAKLYVAPEELAGIEAGPVAGDVFALGALAYLIFTGKAPAESVLELRARLRDSNGLDLAEGMDAPNEDLREIVLDATRPQVDQRTASVRDLLEFLDIALGDRNAPPGPTDIETVELVDPLQADKGDMLEGGWQVKRRLGKGATAVALLATRFDRREVLKVALDPQHHERLRMEHEVLQAARHKGIVTSFDVDSIGGRTTLHLELAGDQTLAQHIQGQGTLELGLLQRWGDDLLEILEHLEGEGIAHRDIKPDNLGIKARKPNDELHLMLFDFSLSRTSAENLQAGTPGYIDPFLEERPNKRWDWMAERWGVAITLFEMATGSRPKWPGGGDPSLTPGLELNIQANLFDPAVASPLREFFTKALRRNPAERFNTVGEMRAAWRDALAAADVPVLQVTNLGDEAAMNAAVSTSTRDTALVELHLTPRALDVLGRVNVHTAGDLADTSLQVLQMLSGVGDKTRREIGRLARRLQEKFVTEVDDVDLTGLVSIDRLAGLLYRKGSATSPDTLLVRMLLEPHLPVQVTITGGAPLVGQWPSQSDVAAAAGVALDDVREAVAEATARWKKISAFSLLRAELHSTLLAAGGVMSVDELASAALDLRGSAAPLEVRLLRARAVVRAVIEEDQTRPEPQWVLRRDGDRVVVADDTNEMVEGVAMAEWALCLGDAADAMVAGDVLPGTTEVLERLAEVSPPHAMVPVGEARMIRLAASCSSDAATSSRLDLYPRRMPADRAVLLARSVLVTAGSLSVEAVRSRVRARFPEAQPVPDRPQLDHLLEAVGLVWSAEALAYRLPQARTVSQTTGPTRLVTKPGDATVDIEKEAAVEFGARMARLVGNGGFCAVNVDPRHVERAEHQLVVQHGLELVDLDMVLIDAMQQLAADAGADWSVVMDADVDPTAPEWRLLKGLVKTAVDSIRHQLVTGHTHVLLTSAGLLARYGQVDLLGELRDLCTGTRPVAGSSLRSVVVIVASEHPEQLPILGDVPVPVIGPNQWTSLPRRWLDSGGRVVAGGPL